MRKTIKIRVTYITSFKTVELMNTVIMKAAINKFKTVRRVNKVVHRHAVKIVKQQKENIMITTLKNILI